MANVKTKPLLKGSMGRPRDEMAHKAVLAATVEVVKEVGYSNISIEKIAARAKVGKGTIYRWWQGKYDLVFEAFFTRKLRLNDIDSGSLEQDVLALVESAVTIFRKPHLVSVLLGQWGEAMENSNFSRDQIERTDEAMGIYRRVLGAAYKRGDIVTKPDVETFYDTLLGLTMVACVRNPKERKSDLVKRVHVAIMRQLT